MKILCINGQGGVGKDSFVFFCGTPSTGVYNYSMVDDIKTIATQIGWDGKKTLKDRKFLSDLKDLADSYNDFSFERVLDKLRTTSATHCLALLNDGITNDEKDLVCFVHARESRDIERWKQRCGARAILVRRPEVEGEYGNHADDHVFDCDYDYYINNNGSLEDLRGQAHKFIKHIREERWESYIWK